VSLLGEACAAAVASPEIGPGDGIRLALRRTLD
jgi:hypothetical protein